MGSEVMLGRPLGGPLGGGLGLRPAVGGGGSLPGALPVDVLLVGGGGSGEQEVGSLSLGGPSGGGAGQVLQVTLWLVMGSYPVVVGLGGRIAPLEDPPVLAGGDTTFAGLRALGGGNGATFDPGFGRRGATTGASTGGQFRSSGRPFWGRAITGFLGSQPGSGDSGNGPFNFGGAGGGAAGPGLNGGENIRALGGPGVISSISGVPVEYGRGGHGSLNNDTAPTPSPGWGDGGGARGIALPGGVTVGRPGILIISYETGTQTWLGGDVTQVGNRTIHTLTADGTLTRTA
jgi:hypothetical protein